jgi:hypothetical protein
MMKLQKATFLLHSSEQQSHCLAMHEEFLRFKQFPDKQTAEDFAEVLKQKNVEYRIGEDALVFDPGHAFNPLNKNYVITIKQTDFKAASNAYDEYFAGQLNQVPEDYYLFSFSDDELMEIIGKPDEWGAFDYLLAQDLLKKRGVEISRDKTDRLKADRYKALAQPEGEPVKNIVGYYIISILFFPAGIIIGTVWGYSKKLLPDGYKVYIYNKDIRRHGRIIFIISMIQLLAIVLFRIISRM